MRVLLDRIQHNETRMNNLCQRLSNLTQLSKESQDEQPFSDEELKILEEVRRECGAQNKTSKT